MAFSIKTQSVGKVSVLTCAGRIIQGAESEKLRQQVDNALKHGPFIVVDLAAVEFIDSSGLGLLARLLNRAQAASGGLKLCGVSPKITEVLRVTRLEKIFQSYASSDDAVAAFGQPSEPTGAPLRPPPDVLCVHPSADVLAYFREVLRQAGYVTITAESVSDAVRLVRVMQPKLVVLGAAARQEPDTRALEALQKSATSVIDLPEGFADRDAGEVGRDLIRLVRTRLPNVSHTEVTG